MSERLLRLVGNAIGVGLILAAVGAVAWLNVIVWRWAVNP